MSPTITRYWVHDLPQPGIRVELSDGTMDVTRVLEPEWDSGPVLADMRLHDLDESLAQRVLDYATDDDARFAGVEASWDAAWDAMMAHDRERFGRLDLVEGTCPECNEPYVIKRDALAKALCTSCCEPVLDRCSVCANDFRHEELDAARRCEDCAAAHKRIRARERAEDEGVRWL